MQRLKGLGMLRFKVHSPVRIVTDLRSIHCKSQMLQSYYSQHSQGGQPFYLTWDSTFHHLLSSPGKVDCFLYCVQDERLRIKCQAASRKTEGLEWENQSLSICCNSRSGMLYVQKADISPSTIIFSCYGLDQNPSAAFEQVCSFYYYNNWYRISV